MRTDQAMPDTFVASMVLETRGQFPGSHVEASGKDRSAAEPAGKYSHGMTPMLSRTSMRAAS